MDDNENLTLNDDIMVSGETYEIYATPFLSDAWIECNGQTISDSDSPFDGTVTDDLNATVQVSSTATAGGAGTLTDSGEAWSVDEWTNFELEIISGTGLGQIAVIDTNTATILTILGKWITDPDATSVYVIRTPPRFLRGGLTSGAVGGESVHFLTEEELAVHRHGLDTQFGGSGTLRYGSTVNSREDKNTNNTGGDRAHENRPPFMNVIWVMRIK